MKKLVIQNYRNIIGTTIQWGTQKLIIVDVKHEDEYGKECYKIKFKYYNSTVESNLLESMWIFQDLEDNEVPVLVFNLPWMNFPIKYFKTPFVFFEDCVRRQYKLGSDIEVKISNDKN